MNIEVENPWFAWEKDVQMSQRVSFLHLCYFTLGYLTASLVFAFHLAFPCFIHEIVPKAPASVGKVGGWGMVGLRIS